MKVPVSASGRTTLLLVIALTTTLGNYLFSSETGTSSSSIVAVVDAFVASSTSTSRKKKTRWRLSARPKATASTHAPPTSSSEASPSTSCHTTSEIPAITERILSITEHPSVAIVIDAENVRGKTGFELDHADFLDRLAIWTSLRNNAAGRTLVVVDHGSRSTAHLLHSCVVDGADAGDDAGDDDNEREGGAEGTAAALCVAFAGPNVKADDVIARDVRWLLSSAAATHLMVITADQELARRCRSAVHSHGRASHGTNLQTILRRKGGHKKMSRKARKRQCMRSREGRRSEEERGEEDDDVALDDANIPSNSTVPYYSTENRQRNTGTPTIEIISPESFLEDLEQASNEWFQRQREQTIALEEKSIKNDTEITTTISINNDTMPAPLGTLQSLIEVRGEILSLESTIRTGCSPHTRLAMTRELRKFKSEWREILSSLSVTASAATGGDGGAGLDGSDRGGGRSFASSLLVRSLSSTILWWDDYNVDDEVDGTRRERTEDRIVLAERLRRQLELIVDSNDGGHHRQRLSPTGDSVFEEAHDFEDGGSSLAEMYARYINSMCNYDYG